jgi:Cu-Zn family superoxide dismutase
MHIHEIGSCLSTADPPFSDAGGHFDPGPFGFSNPPDSNHPFHMGDIPNLEVGDNGVGHLKHITSRITLSPGPLSIFDTNGSAVVIHTNPDQGITGVAGASGGPRIACGVIELDN